MNVPRSFNPRLYEILEIDPILMSKAQLSKYLGKWINNNKYSKGSKIYVNDIINELSGLPTNTEYDQLGDGWWNFTTLVYKKWIQRFKDLES